MPYHNFTYKNVEQRLSVIPEYVPELYNIVPAVDPTAHLMLTMEEANFLFTASEMARRENYIAPIFREVLKKLNYRAVLYSQVEFEVDASLQLTGEVDYIITAPPMRLRITRPVMGIAEAKVDNLKSGYGQCIAEMVASRLHNERVHHIHLPQIYGLVTDGLQWQFMELVDQTVRLDARVYNISDLDRILGILIWMIETQLKHIEEAPTETPLLQ